jgi:hypothetical protein
MKEMLVFNGFRSNERNGRTAKTHRELKRMMHKAERRKGLQVIAQELIAASQHLDEQLRLERER